MATNLRPATSIPAGFVFDEVRAEPRVSGPAPIPPALGALAAFSGTYQGSGFNTIFRPDSAKTPTPLPRPGTLDNVLELNLTSETLSFSQPLGNVPNRGSGQQGDVFLNGVHYLQSISDVTTSPATGIHLEPGLWMSVPPTEIPAEGPTLVRMASIPHGTTICAQGTSEAFAGSPTIAPVDITPFPAVAPAAPPFPRGSISFPSQTATDPTTTRIPQDLSPFIAAGTITQEILDDPNTVLRKHNEGLSITGGTVISISTSPPAPLFGGSADNIAFLLGTEAAVTNPKGPGQNAQTIEMFATFWIETVVHTIEIEAFGPASAPLTLRPIDVPADAVAPSFIVRPPTPIDAPRRILVTSTQIQYSQVVLLNFNGLTWPHVSVASLVPAAPIPVPPSAW